MRIMKRISKFFCSILLAVCCCTMAAHAVESAAIVETSTGEEDISVYIKGVEGELAAPQAQIGTTAAQNVTAVKIKDLDVPMKTLIVIDNSLSITDADREKIAAFLQDFLADRLDKEQIAIATFSEQITYLTDYTNDYAMLKSAAEGITYQDQGTYLTDVLYELLSTEYVQNEENVYRRIIVVSDGVDNKAIGYTKDELYALLKENPVSIYTIGCIKGENNEQLENMFALSRMTAADYFVLDDVENTLDITAVMKKDRDIVRVTITPTQESMDGSKKAVKISFPSGETVSSLSADILMPQKQMETVQETPAETPVTKTTPNPEPASAQTQPSGDEPVIKTGVVLAGGIILAIVIGGVVFFLISVQKKKIVTFESADENVMMQLDRNLSESDEKTEMVYEFAADDDDGHTCMIWNDKASCQMVLTDINSPAKSFQAPLNQSVVIGRKSGQCDIVLDYEKSVSGRHCRITVRDGKFYICDLQSANGTYVNDSRVLTETEIVSGNIIKLGRLQMRFEVR